MSVALLSQLSLLNNPPIIVASVDFIQTPDLEIPEGFIFCCLFIIGHVWVSLHAPQLISWVLKLIIIEVSSDHHINNHMART